MVLGFDRGGSMGRDPSVRTRPRHAPSGTDPRPPPSISDPRPHRCTGSTADIRIRRCGLATDPSRTRLPPAIRIRSLNAARRARDFLGSTSGDPSDAIIDEHQESRIPPPNAARRGRHIFGSGDGAPSWIGTKDAEHRLHFRIRLESVRAVMRFGLGSGRGSPHIEAGFGIGSLRQRRARQDNYEQFSSYADHGHARKVGLDSSRTRQDLPFSGDDRTPHVIGWPPPPRTRMIRGS